MRFILSLHPIEDAQLIDVFLSIPKEYTVLDLRWNSLGKKSIYLLRTAFSIIPSNIHTLDLAWNNLGMQSARELATLFSNIPSTITSLNLIENDLFQLSTHDLVYVFNAIPNTVKHLNLRYNALFVNRSHQENDQILRALYTDSGLPRQNIQVSKNGESDLSRSIVPLLTLSKVRKLPNDVINEMLLFLSPQKTSFKEINTKTTKILSEHSMRIQNERHNYSFKLKSMMLLCSAGFAVASIVLLAQHSLATDPVQIAFLKSASVISVVSFGLFGYQALKPNDVFFLQEELEKRL